MFECSKSANKMGVVMNFVPTDEVCMSWRCAFRCCGALLMLELWNSPSPWASFMFTHVTAAVVLDLVAALQLMLAFRHEICFIALNAQRNSLCRVFSASLCFPLGVRAVPSLSLSLFCIWLSVSLCFLSFIIMPRPI